MEVEHFSNMHLQIATLAGRALHLVSTNPDTAYPKALAEILESFPGISKDYHENLVGEALRSLEREEMLTSDKVAHPKGHPGTKVKLYRLTPKGAFMVALAATIPKAA